MVEYKSVTRGNITSLGRQKVVIACEKCDIKYRDELVKDILSVEFGIDCAVLYHPDSIDVEDEIRYTSLFVFVISKDAMSNKKRYLKLQQFARQIEASILPVVIEPSILSDFNAALGDMHSVTYSIDSYADKLKLKEALEQSLVSSDVIDEIRNTFRGKAFVSYRRKNRAEAEQFIDKLYHLPHFQGWEIWYDHFLLTGENFNSTIIDAISQSKLFIMLVTPEIAEQSNNYVLDVEYPEAIKRGIPIIPIEISLTDKDELSCFEGLPECISPDSSSISAVLDRILPPALELTAREKYLMGTAFYNGVDVRTNRTLGIELLSESSIAGDCDAPYKLAEIYRSSDLGVRDTYVSLQWALRSANNAKRLGNKKRELYAYILASDLSLSRSCLDDAITYSKAATESSELLYVNQASPKHTPQYIEAIFSYIFCLRSLANLYVVKRDAKSAIYHLEVFKEISDSYAKYLCSEDYKKLPLSEKSDIDVLDRLEYIRALGNTSLAEVYYFNFQYDKAFSYASAAHHSAFIAKHGYDNGNPHIQSVIIPPNLLMADILLLQGKIDSALNYALDTYKLCKSALAHQTIDSYLSTLRACALLGRIYNKMKKHSDAEAKLKEGRELFLSSPVSGHSIAKKVYSDILEQLFFSCLMAGKKDEAEMIMREKTEWCAKNALSNNVEDLINLAVTYYNNRLFYSGNHKQVEQNLLKGLNAIDRISEDIADAKQKKALLLQALGDNYIEENRTDKALSVHSESFSLLQSLNNESNYSSHQLVTAQISSCINIISICVNTHDRKQELWLKQLNQLYDKLLDFDVRGDYIDYYSICCTYQSATSEYAGKLALEHSLKIWDSARNRASASNKNIVAVFSLLIHRLFYMWSIDFVHAHNYIDELIRTFGSREIFEEYDDAIKGHEDELFTAYETVALLYSDLSTVFLNLGHPQEKIAGALSAGITYAEKIPENDRSSTIYLILSDLYERRAETYSVFAPGKRRADLNAAKHYEIQGNKH